MIEEAVYAIGKAHAGLTALIGAGDNVKLFPEAEQQEHAVPRVVFEKDNPRPVAGIWQDSGWYHTIFSFTAYGASALAAKQVIDQVRLAYQRYHSNGAVVAGTSHKVDDVEATGEADADYDHELGQFFETVELEFFHN